MKTEQTIKMMLKNNQSGYCLNCKQTKHGGFIVKLKKVFLILSLTTIFSVLGYMYYSSSNSYANPTNSETTVEQRGCCSHHQGVCGCENGRTVCCDGTLSPSCSCDE